MTHYVLWNGTHDNTKYVKVLLLSFDWQHQHYLHDDKAAFASSYNIIDNTRIDQTLTIHEE